jgi:uncharacterized membrane protein YhaH (DUF805 family)
MKGNVIGFDADTNTGAISGHDGKRYDFATADWHAHGTPRHGDLVDFTPDGQRASQIFLMEPEYVKPSFGTFYFSARGRISRSQYWLRFLVPLLIIGFILGILKAANGETVSGPFTTLSNIFNLVMLWPGIAILIKRIHDRNKSGVLAWVLYGPLILLILFGIGTAIAAMSGNTSTTAVLGIISLILLIIVLIVSIWFFIEFGCMRGTIGANTYGPDPVPHQ